VQQQIKLGTLKAAKPNISKVYESKSFGSNVKDTFQDIELLHDSSHLLGGDLFGDVVHNPVYSSVRNFTFTFFNSGNLEKIQDTTIEVETAINLEAVYDIRSEMRSNVPPEELYENIEEKAPK